jgi:hypothetical protein
LASARVLVETKKPSWLKMVPEGPNTAEMSIKTMRPVLTATTAAEEQRAIAVAP